MGGHCDLAGFSLVHRLMEAWLAWFAAGEGLIMPAGNYRRPFVFSGVRSFSKFGIKIMVRA